MKKILYLTVWLTTVFVSCKDLPYQNISGTIQGTTYHIVYQSDKFYGKEIDSILQVVDNSVSIYNENSLIYKLNKNLTNQVDEHIKFLFNAAIEISETSQGRYDITVGPLVNIYGFGKGKKLTNINDTVIDSILQFVGYKKVRIENNKLIKDDPRIELDMNSIAQGYTCDLVGDFLERNGIRNYMIEIGGEILTNGNNEFGMPWRIGIEKPIENTDIVDRKIEMIIGLKNTKKGIATSGNYRRFYFENGVKFTHSLNPFTGKPLKDSLVSATVIADNATIADGYATALMVSGYEGAKRIIEKKGFEAFLIYLDKNGKYKFYYTPKFEKYIIEKDKEQ